MGDARTSSLCSGCGYGRGLLTHERRAFLRADQHETRGSQIALSSMEEYACRPESCESGAGARDLGFNPQYKTKRPSGKAQTCGFGFANTECFASC